MISIGDAILTLGADPRPLQQALQQMKQNVSASMHGVSQSAQSSLSPMFENWKAASVQVGASFTAMGATITGALGFAVKGAMDFNAALAEVNSLGVKDLGALKEAVTEVSTEYGLNMTESVKAAYQAISAGVSEMETPKVLAEAAKAATAGVTDLATAVELGTSVNNAFGISMSDIGKTYDQAFIAVKDGVTTFEELAGSVGRVAPAFSALKIPTDEMFASITALTKGGIGTNEAVTYLNAVLTNILKPTSEASKLAEELGISFGATAVESQGLSGFLKQVMEATGGNVDTMAQLFGSSEALKAVLALTGEQAASFDATLASMRSGVSATNEAFKKMTENNPEFQWKQLVASLQELRIEMGEAFLPVLKQLVEAMTPLLKGFSEWAKANPTLLTTIVTIGAAIGALMAVFGPLLLMLPGIVTAVGLLSTAFTAVAAVVSAPMIALGALIAGVVLAVGVAIYEIYDHWDSFAWAFNELWDGLTSGISTAWEGITGILFGAWDYLKSGWDWFVESLSWGVEQLSNAFDWVYGMFEWVWDGISSIFNSGIEFVSGIWNGFMDMLKGGIQTIKDAWGWIASFFGAGGGGEDSPNGGDVPGFASGVNNFKGGWAMVGEKGPELTYLPRGASVFSNPETQAMLKAGGNVSVNVTLNGNNYSPNEIGNIIAERVSYAMARQGAF